MKRTMTLLVLGLALNSLRAAELKQETITAWEAYTDAARTTLQSRLGSEKPFLASDEVPGQTARLRAGEVVVSSFRKNMPQHVPSGLIHHWVGAAFVPNGTLPEAFAVLRNYGRYRGIYRPAVVDSTDISSNDNEDRFSVVLINRPLISKAALDCSYRAVYTKLDEHRWYSIAETVNIVEIADYGATTQHTLPKGKETGLIWRMVNIVRFEERDGGLYVEVEAIALSRDVPASLRWLVDPIIRRVSRDSLTTSIQQTKDAVKAGNTNVISTKTPRTPTDAASQAPALSFR